MRSERPQAPSCFKDFQPEQWSLATPRLSLTPLSTLVKIRLAPASLHQVTQDRVYCLKYMQSCFEKLKVQDIQLSTWFHSGTTGGNWVIFSGTQLKCRYWLFLTSRWTNNSGVELINATSTCSWFAAACFTSYREFSKCSLWSSFSWNKDQAALTSYLQILLLLYLWSQNLDTSEITPTLSAF